MGMIHRHDRSSPGQVGEPPGWVLDVLSAARPAASAYWLSVSPLPAPALPVARLHGLDLETVSIAWARPAGGSDA